uniref:Uncharacterized protein n=1 Tax=Paenibacillus athensensis TaxID=1967502 RepID=A0A4Y8PVA3_9BACL
MTKNGYVRTTWFAEGEIHFRQTVCGEEKTLIWVSSAKSNVGFTMIMYDFIEWCRREMNLNIEVDMSWNHHRGFAVSNSDWPLVRSEMIRFIHLHNIQASENDDIFSDGEWYS